MLRPKGSPIRLGIIGISFKLKPQFRQRGRIELPSRLGKIKPKPLLPQSKAQRYKQLRKDFSSLLPYPWFFPGFGKSRHE